MKNKKVLFVLLAVSILSFATYVYAAQDSVFYRFGELTKKQIDLSQTRSINSTDNAIEAKDFTISNDYIENLTEQDKLTGIDTDAARKMALSQIIVKRSLYYYAIDNGYVIDDKVIQESIDKNREEMKTASNYDDFTTFLKGLNMTEDEYWTQEFDLYKLSYTLGEFKKAEKQKFAQKNEGQFDAQELNEKFGDYFMGITEKAVDMQKVKLIGSINWAFSRDDAYIKDLCY